MKAILLERDRRAGRHMAHSFRRLRAILLTSEPIDRSLQLAAGGAAIANVCGRPANRPTFNTWKEAGGDRDQP